jgi:hypothetical protein
MKAVAKARVIAQWQTQPFPVTPSENKSSHCFEPHTRPAPRVPTTPGIDSDQEKRMPSQLKSETARINGAKSRGPKTAEGREKSSRNSVTHGLTGRNIVVLECENQDDFWAVHAEPMEIHQPATPAEKDLVEQMVSGVGSTTLQPQPKATKTKSAKRT